VSPVGRAVVVGKAGIELVLQLPRTPMPQERLVVGGRWRAGGRGLATALALKTAGLAPHLLTRVGEDAAGRWVESLLHRARVECSVERDPLRPTATVIPVTAGEEGYTLEVRGAEAFWDPDRLLARLESLKPVDWLWLQGEISREANLVAALWVKDHGGQVVVEPEPASQIGEELLAIADYLLPTAGALGALCRSQPPRSRDEAQLLAGWLLTRHPGLSVLVVPEVAGGALVAARQGYWWGTPPGQPAEGTLVAARFFAALIRGVGLEGALWAALEVAPAQ